MLFAGEMMNEIQLESAPETEGLIGEEAWLLGRPPRRDRLDLVEDTVAGGGPLHDGHHRASALREGRDLMLPA